MTLFKPEPTWADYARWSLRSVAWVPGISAIALAAILLWGIRNPLTWIWVAITVAGLVQVPANIRGYQLARKHVDAGDADPPDLATLKRTLKDQRE
jgi:hypothetical protein